MIMYTIQKHYRMINTASFQQAQDCSAIENTHKEEDLQQSVKYVEDIRSDIICIYNTVDDEYISCSTSPTTPSSPFLVVMSKITESLTLLQEDIMVEKEFDNDHNSDTSVKLNEVIANLQDSNNEEFLRIKFILCYYKFKVQCYINMLYEHKLYIF
ncbi:uncharacterized protein LOC105184029 [Harpegnathos saltator]|uniref:uncharacterized protein LOC105184029 n=1 Tax=Harpegnathos saltator TaxID=610380 RepID=UPI00058AE658|nr:uncharacterized protein LOC105184029 [Harpegnathos saltator]